MPDGTKYTALKDIVLKDAFDEYLARIVCFCFSISPQPFVAQVNRATAETAKEQATEVVAALSTSNALAESGGDYSDPAVFFGTVHKHGWGCGIQQDYLRTMLQRIGHF